MSEISTSGFIRVIQLNEDPPSSCPREAESRKAAIWGALEELQSVVAKSPGLKSAVILMGEGPSENDARWIGGWVWSKGTGFVWRELD